MRKEGDLEVNNDSHVIRDFGYQWAKYNQSTLSHEELKLMFDAYFSIFPWNKLPDNAVGFDLGCGSGRWAKYVAPRVKTLHCIEPSSQALAVAKENLSSLDNCEFHLASDNNIPLKDNSMDYGYSIGVLHHIPDTSGGIKACVRKLKKGAPLLLYLYYAFDNRPMWFRLLWKISECGRIVLSRAPFRVKCFCCDLLATFIYWPIARTSYVLEKKGLEVESLPLSYYRKRSFYVMRTDALDRFGTRLEKRFTKLQIQNMMEEAGLQDIRFNEDPPYWVAIGTKK